jgi:large subunit ribosomal protein L16
MKLVPTDKKFNKVFKVKKKYFNRIENRTFELKFGTYGIKALTSGLLTAKHFSGLQLLIRRSLKRRGSFIFRKLPYTFNTRKPSEVRMGKGKGNFNEWVCPVRAGQILIEFKFKNISELEKLLILRKCIKRLPVKAQMINMNLKLIEKNTKQYILNN